MSLFDQTYNFDIDRKHTGFDYSEVLLKRTLSSRMFNNDKTSGFLQRINTIMVEIIDSVKLIKTYRNYTVHKNDRYVN